MSHHSILMAHCFLSLVECSLQMKLIHYLNHYSTLRLILQIVIVP